MRGPLLLQVKFSLPCFQANIVCSSLLITLFFSQMIKSIQGTWSSTVNYPVYSLHFINNDVGQTLQSFPPGTVYPSNPVHSSLYSNPATVSAGENRPGLAVSGFTVDQCLVGPLRTKWQIYVPRHSSELSNFLAYIRSQE